MEQRTIKMPVEMLKAIQQYIDNHPEESYTSVSDFLREQARHALAEKKKQK